ncbi:MAG TPA: sigma 54-interacting transcriptional regulator [Polyangiaceae bacterium]|nr:sigma 54-interacting transcriptional regulator [Polyangiaceae bacterium]
MVPDDDEHSTLELQSGLPSAAASKPACLTVVACADGSVVGRHVWIGEGGELKVGRNPEEGLKLGDPRVSRVQFRVGWDSRQGRHRFTDAGSRNGTFLNGRALDSSVLNDGDVLRAGDTLLVFDYGDAMAERRNQAARAAKSVLPVLLQGPTGTGKELLARYIHEQSARSGAYVPVNCAALPRELLAAELFGHTRGAFSGAAVSRPGLFAAAESGTLFLDEIGDMPLELQPSLLRAVELRTIRPVGADSEATIDVRIVAATNQDLDSACKAGRFRHDLHARLAQIVIHLPALTGRRREILALLRTLAEREGAELTIEPDAAEAILLWEWPRNVRELEALVRSLVVVRGSTTLTLAELTELKADVVEHLREERAGADPAFGTEGNPLADRERLRELIERAAGNISQVARELGVTRAQVYRWMKRLGLSHKE